MHKSPPRRATVISPSFPIHVAGAAPDGAPTASHELRTDAPDQARPITEPAIRATLAGVVQAAESRRRQAEQTNRAAGEGLQARNSHD